MRAYSRSVHLLLVLITGVYSHCISLISIGTEQISSIDGYKRNVLISGVLISIQVKCAITPLRVVTSTSYSGVNNPQRVRHEMFAMENGNAGCLATELRPVRPRIVVLQTSQIGVHAYHMAPVT